MVSIAFQYLLVTCHKTLKFLQHFQISFGVLFLSLPSSVPFRILFCEDPNLFFPGKFEKSQNVSLLVVACATCLRLLYIPCADTKRILILISSTEIPSFFQHWNFVLSMEKPMQHCDVLRHHFLGSASPLLPSWSEKGKYGWSRDMMSVEDGNEWRLLQRTGKTSTRLLTFSIREPPGKVEAAVARLHLVRTVRSSKLDW